MDYNATTISIGKVREYNGISGEIVAKEGSFLFTSENIDKDETILSDDLVFFRGEEIRGVKKAFFVKKLVPEKNIDEQIYAKTKSIKYLKENE